MGPLCLRNEYAIDRGEDESQIILKNISYNTDIYRSCSTDNMGHVPLGVGGRRSAYGGSPLYRDPSHLDS